MLITTKELEALDGVKFYCENCKVWWKKYHQCVTDINSVKRMDLIRRVNASLV